MYLITVGEFIQTGPEKHLPTEHRRVPYRKMVSFAQQGIADRTGEAPYVEN